MTMFNGISDAIEEDEPLVESFKDRATPVAVNKFSEALKQTLQPKVKELKRSIKKMRQHLLQDGGDDEPSEESMSPARVIEPSIP